jgi:hypothetical protein
MEKKRAFKIALRALGTLLLLAVMAFAGALIWSRFWFHPHAREQFERQLPGYYDAK